MLLLRHAYDLLFSSTYCLASKCPFSTSYPPSLMGNQSRLNKDRLKNGPDPNLRTWAIQLCSNSARGDAVTWGGEGVDRSWHLPGLSASSVATHTERKRGGNVGVQPGRRCSGREKMIFSVLHEIWMWHLHPGTNRSVEHSWKKMWLILATF